MARRRRVHRRGRKRAARRVHRRRNYAASGLINPRRRRRRSYRRRARLANPRRRARRRGYRRSPRRRYRRNPSLMGFSFGLPPMDAVLFTGAGLVIPPIMSGYLMNMLPADWRTSRAAYYGVKAASVLIPSMLVRKFVSTRAGNFMLIGGAASFAVDLVREFMPNLLPSGVGAQPFLGFYERMPRAVGAGMGRYNSIPVRSQPVQRTPLIMSTPERLSPGGRF